MDPSSKIDPLRQPSIDPVQAPPPKKEQEGIQIKKTSQKEEAIPSVINGKVDLPQLPNVNSIKVMDEELSDEFQDIVEEIEEQLDDLEDSMKPNHKPVRRIANERMHKELNKLEAKKLESGIFEDGAENLIGILQLPTEALHNVVSEPYDYAVEPFLSHNHPAKGRISQFINPVETARTFLQGVELIGNGAALIIQTAHFHEAKNLLETKEIQLKNKPGDENLRKYVTKLRSYLSFQWETLKEKIVNFASSFATVGLKTTSFVIDIVGGVVPFAKSGVGWGISMLDVMSESISLWRDQKAKTTHEAWMTHIASDQRTLHQAQELLAQRQERMILRKAQKMTFTDLKAAFKGIEIDFADKNINSFEDFKALISQPEMRREIARKFLNETDQKEDTINVMTRNGIQALAEAKARNEKKFYDFNLIKSKLGLTLACISTALTIVLEVLAMVGVIAVAASTLALPGLGFFLMGLTLTGIGLFFFYKHKPNLFKAFIRGVNFRLAFLHIPSKIRSLQLSRNKEEIAFLERASARNEQLLGLLEKQNTLDRAQIPPSLRKVLDKFHRETEKKVEKFQHLDEKVKLQKITEGLKHKNAEYKKKLDLVKEREKELLEKVNFWTGKEGKVTKLQNQLTEAGNKDFALANRLITTAQKKEMNIPLVLVENILDPQLDFEFDEDTIRVLNEKMGIDIKQIPQQLGKVDKEKLMENLKEFFKMDDAELLTYMKHHLTENVALP